MSDLTREDLKTILLFGIHIAKIDGEFDVWEKKILARFADAMGLSEEEKDGMIRQELSLADGLKQLSGQEARSLLLKTMCAVSHSDGEAHPDEIEFINKVIGRMGGQVFILSPSEWGTYEKEVLDELKSHA